MIGRRINRWHILLIVGCLVALVHQGFFEPASDAAVQTDASGPSSECADKSIEPKLDNIVQALFTVEQKARSETLRWAETSFARIFPWIALSVFDLSLGPGQIKASTVSKFLGPEANNILGETQADHVAALVDLCRAPEIAAALLQAKFGLVFDSQQSFLTRKQVINIAQFWNGQSMRYKNFEHAFSNLTYNELVYDYYHHFVAEAMRNKLTAS